MTIAQIRNFCIIAHIDHGKTTLTDRFLELTTTTQARTKTERLLDANPIERERGITIKLAPVTMQYTHPKTKEVYSLNLIDTPGHIDFGYEVSRSLAACEGALLVIDATQGIQAQTLTTFYQARDLGLAIIPVLNKIDLPTADVDRTLLEVMELCEVEEHQVIQVSAKTGLNVAQLLEEVVATVPAPTGNPEAPLRALLMSSYYDPHKGAVAMVRLIDGTMKKQKLGFVQAGVSLLPIEIGQYAPEMTPTEVLQAGQVGYVATGLKEIRTLKIGDTLTTQKDSEAVEALPGFKDPQPMVYMELYPVDTDAFPDLQDSIEKLALRDAALRYSGTHSPALGSGLRVGFLGILHAEIVLERLRREFSVDIIATSPSVTYNVTFKDGTHTEVYTPVDFPDPSLIESVEEPVASLHIMTPTKYMSVILDAVRERRGEYTGSMYVGDRVELQCSLPLAELITDFQDVLKSATAGYASLEYHIDHFQKIDAVKVSILLNHEVVEALSIITVRDQAERVGRELVSRLKDVIPRQMFEVPVQAAIGGKVIARETIKAYRKDVTAKLYGGDVTRRKKLLAKQAKGKKRMKQVGKLQLDQDTFLAVLKRQ